MAAGLEAITDGELLIGGQLVNDLRPRERDVAMVFQNYALYPHMTVEDNIGFGLKMRHTASREIRERVAAIARVLDLAELLHRKPRALSGGQRQRVAMGRAIVRDPRVFLMDEPLSNLDAKLRVQMRSEIARIQREVGATTIYVTHDQVEAMTMGDRVAVLRKGRLQQVEEPQRLYDEPANLFVATFIGSPAMNLVQAGVRSDGDALVLGIGSRSLRLPAGLRTPSLDALAAREGRVAVGIRPEQVRERPGGEGELWQSLRGTVEMVEALGSERLVHVAIEADPVVTDAVLEVAADVDVAVGQELQSDAESRRSLFICRFAPDSAVRVGDAADIWINVGRLHMFDLETGEALRHPVKNPGV
jgi:multiple sugar transport system ATP-binding protein